MRPDPRKPKKLTTAEKLLKLWPLGLLLAILLAFGVWYALRPPPVMDAEGVRKYVEDRPIMRAVQLYGSFQSANGRPPSSMDELRAWAKKQPKERLELMGISDVDAVTTSPRDNQPYRIAPTNKAVRGGMSPVIIYEATGVDGKRQTASSMGSTAEMNEETLRTHVPNLK